MGKEENDFNYENDMEQKKNDLFIKQVKESLKELGMPQYELAEKLGISSQTISQFMKGNRAFPLSRKKQIAEILNIDMVSVSNGPQIFKENIMFAKLACGVISSGDMKSGIISTLGIKNEDIPEISKNPVIDFNEESGFKTLYDLLMFGYIVYNNYIKLTPEQSKMLNHFVDIEHIISQNLTKS